DEIVDDDLSAQALTYARRLLADRAPLRPVSAKQVQADAQLFADFEQSIARKARGYLAPFRCIEAIKAAVELPYAQGVQRERELFLELRQSSQSQAQRHVFFAERAVAKVPDIDRDTPKREVNSVGIVGAGMMGGGIAMNFV